MSKKIVVSLVAALSLAVMGCGPELDSGDADALKSKSSGSTTTTSTATTYADHTTDVQSSTPTWKTSFMIATTYNVYVATDISSSGSGHHSLKVEFFAPGGSLYQTNTIAYAAGVTPNTGEVAADVTSTGYRVWTSIPVAGTTIDQYGLVGTWNAQSWIDTATSASATIAFQLQ